MIENSLSGKANFSKPVIAKTERTRKGQPIACSRGVPKHSIVRIAAGRLGGGAAKFCFDV